MYIQEAYISPKYKLDDCIDLFLSLTPESDERSWSKAISIFRDRIEGRFLSIVKTLLDESRNDPSVSNGFAIMALNCLLIETLQQFYDGARDSKRRSRESFVTFLTHSYCFDAFDDRTATIFYEDVRCGILHQAETKNKVMLSFYSPYMVDEETNPPWIMFDISRFTEALVDEYERYLSKIIDRKQKSIRRAFCKKWKYMVEQADVIRQLSTI